MPWVGSAVFSPDKTRIASESNGKTVGLWDATTGRMERKLEGHSDGVGFVAFSPDSTRVASASYDQNDSRVERRDWASRTHT